MTREATITQEKINAVADALLAAGQKPTTRAVHDALGSGSMATIVKLMQNWKSGQMRTGPTMEDAIDSDVARAISNLLARRITEAITETQAKCADLHHDLASVIAENERQAAELGVQAVELASLRAQVQHQSGQIEQLLADAKRDRQQLASEIQSREAAQIALAKTELRIEALPGLQEELKSTRAEAKRAGEEAAQLRGTASCQSCDAGRCPTTLNHRRRSRLVP